MSDKIDKISLTDSNVILNLMKKYLCMVALLGTTSCASSDTSSNVSLWLFISFFISAVIVILKKNRTIKPSKKELEEQKKRRDELYQHVEQIEEEQKAVATPKKSKSITYNKPVGIKKDYSGHGITIVSTIITERSLAEARFDGLHEAESLKHDNPEEALKLLLPLAAKETKSVYVHHQCLICYRNLKQYEKEIPIIKEILQIIDDFTEEDAETITEYENMKGHRSSYETRLVYVERIVANKKNHVSSEKKQYSVPLKNENTNQYFNEGKNHITATIDSKQTIDNNYINFAVKGLIYRSNIEIAAARMCDIGDTLILLKDETNEYDSSAIKVFTLDGYHIGYIEKQYSKIICSRFDFIQKCKISKIILSEVPYIFADIFFSEVPQKQMQFKPKDFQITPEHFMIDHNLLNNPKYHRIFSGVIGTYFLQKENITIAKDCMQGDIVTLKQEPDIYNPYKINVYFKETIIGFIDKISSFKVNSIFKNITQCYITNSITSKCPYIGIEIFYPIDIECPTPTKEEQSIIDSISEEQFPIYREAELIKKNDPQKALEMILPFTELEKGIELRHLCCFCYRQIKDYTNEKKMIESILSYIDSVSLDDLPRNNVFNLKGCKDTYLKRLETVNRRLKNN